MSVEGMPLYHASLLIQGMLLLLTFLLFVVLVCFFERWLRLKHLLKSSKRLAVELAPYLEEGNWKQAHALCEKETGAFAEVIQMGLVKHTQGRKEIKQAMEEGGTYMLARLESYLQLLYLLAQIAPLIGLFTTVLGGIQLLGKSHSLDFLRIDMQNALLPTAVGLMVAIIASTAYSLLTLRMQRCALEMELAASTILNLLAEDGGKP